VFKLPAKDAEDLEVVRQELYKGVKELIQDEASVLVKGAQEVGEVLQKRLIQEEVELLAQGASQVKDYLLSQEPEKGTETMKTTEVKLLPFTVLLMQPQSPDFFGAEA